MDAIIDGFGKAIGLLAEFDPDIYSIFGLSLIVSGLSTLIGVILGIPGGILLGAYDFKGKHIIVRILYMLMSTPPVIMGLFVFLIIMRRGPLGFLNLSFTTQAMVIAQTCLITPIITGLVYNYTKERAKVIKELGITLGARGFAMMKLYISEVRIGIMTAVISGFGRGISEVGAVMLVGGNIKGHTRVMTTYISQLQNMGEYSTAIAVGIILLAISFIINSVLYRFQYK